MSVRTHRESFGAGIALVRPQDFAGALPFLEHAREEPQLVWAGSVLKYAQARAAGNTTAEVKFGDNVFRFALDTGNFGLEVHHADGRFFEANELGYFQAVLPSRSVIVDVGANTGNHLVFFASLLGAARVVPVEPVPQAVAALRRNLALNGLTVDERGLGLAAGREAGWLHVNRDPAADLVLAQVSEDSRDPSADRVPAVRLDDLVPERVDLLKIDVEGFEAQALAGSERILREDKPLLMIEMQHDKREALLRYLADFRYKPVAAFDGVGYHNVFLRNQ